MEATESSNWSRKQIKFVDARRDDQHARRMRYPINCSNGSSDDQLVAERQPIRGRHVARQIVIREAEYKKLVRIRYRRHIVGLQ